MDVAVWDMYPGLTKEEALIGARHMDSSVNTVRVLCTSGEYLLLMFCLIFPTRSFSCMVSADVLIDSPSSFCFAAAVLSYGEVWDHAFWHASPLDRWISCLWVDGEERYNNLDPCEKHY